MVAYQLRDHSFLQEQVQRVVKAKEDFQELMIDEGGVPAGTCSLQWHAARTVPFM